MPFNWRLRAIEIHVITRLRLRRALAFGLVVGMWTSPAWAQSTHTVTTVAPFSFSPVNITIALGDSVMWTGLGGNILLFHNAAETDCPATPTSVPNGGFSSGFPGTVATFTHTFNTPGTFCYICEAHVFDGMFGSVTVEAPTAIPALLELGMLGMVLVLGAVGIWTVHRRPPHGLAQP